MTELFQVKIKTNECFTITLFFRNKWQIVSKIRKITHRILAVLYIERTMLFFYFIIDCCCHMPSQFRGFFWMSYYACTFLNNDTQIFAIKIEMSGFGNHAM